MLDNVFNNTLPSFAALALKTGGLDPFTCGLISIAVLAPNGKSFYQIIEPSNKLIYEPKALKVNELSITRSSNRRLRWDFKKSKGSPEILPEASVISNLLVFLKENCKGCFLTSCNIESSRAFLLEAATRNSKRPFYSSWFAPYQPSLEVPLNKDFFHKTFDLRSAALLLHSAKLITLPPSKHNPNYLSTSLESMANSANLTKDSRATPNPLEDASLTLRVLENFQKILSVVPSATINKAAAIPTSSTPVPTIEVLQAPKSLFNLLVEHYTLNLPLDSSNPAYRLLNKNGFVRHAIFKKLTIAQQRELLPRIKSSLARKLPLDNTAI